MIIMATLTVLFASWAGADGGGDPQTDPSTEIYCPKMNDRPCEAYGEFASANAKTASDKALERCKIAYEKCKVKQEEEGKNNEKRCNTVSQCKYGDGLTDVQCSTPACSTQNGLTTCTSTGKYDRNAYKCEVPPTSADGAV